MLDVTGRMLKVHTAEILGDGHGGSRKFTTVEGQLYDGSMQVGEFSITFDGELVNRQGTDVQIIINNQPEMMQRHADEMESEGREVPKAMKEMLEGKPGEAGLDGLNITSMTTSDREIA